MRVQFLRISGLNDYQAKILNKSKDLMNQVLNSEEFKSKILNSYFTETNGLSAAEIYNVLAYGSWDLKIVGYRSWNVFSKVMGYFVSGETIYINTRKITDALTLASLLTHENSHRLGFSHYGIWNTSVPYSLNRIFEACVAELKLK